ncbi:MAG: hypothetical protein P8184_11430 [Calditrichia bacterium]
MNIPRSLKSTFILYSANIFTLLLAWAVTKLNVTYLSVTEFGQFIFFITVINTIYIFFTLGIFESAARLAALSDTGIQYRKNVGASLALALLAYASFTIIFWAIHWLIDSVFEVKISHLVLYFFPLAGAYLFFDFWQKILRGAGKISRLSWLITLPRLIYLACLGILIFVNRFNLLTTTLFNLVGFLAVSIFYIFLEKPDFSGLSQSISRLKAEIKRFGIHIYWSELIAAFLLQSDKLFIIFNLLIHFAVPGFLTGPADK